MADSLIFTAEKSLKDAGDKVSADIKTEVEEKIKSLKGILDTGSKEDLDAKTKELSESLQKIGQAAYQQGQQATQQATSETEVQSEEKEGKSDKSSDEPVEGEVVS